MVLPPFVTGVRVVLIIALELVSIFCLISYAGTIWFRISVTTATEILDELGLLLLGDQRRLWCGDGATRRRRSTAP